MPLLTGKCFSSSVTSSRKPFALTTAHLALPPTSWGLSPMSIAGRRATWSGAASVSRDDRLPCERALAGGMRGANEVAGPDPAEHLWRHFAAVAELGVWAARGEAAAVGGVDEI